MARIAMHRPASDQEGRRPPDAEHRQNEEDADELRGVPARFLLRLIVHLIVLAHAGLRFSRDAHRASQRLRHETVAPWTFFRHRRGRSGGVFAGFVGILAAAASAAPAAKAQDAAVPVDRAEIQLSFAPVAKRAAPAVVNIYARRMAPRRASPFQGDPFFE
ncbi:MAG: hypothetical protein AAF676_10675, partial [Pseudomonadota bacterium]